MNQLQQLLEYQKVDMTITEIEQQLKDSAIRKKLLYARNYLLNSQNQLQQMEVEASELQTSLVAVQNKVVQMTDRYNSLYAKTTALDEESSIQELEITRRDMQELNNQMGKHERDVQNLVNKLTKINQDLKKMATNIPKAKTNYSELKEIYDKELSTMQEKTRPHRANLDRIAKSMDPALLERYKNIKQNCPNPLVQLNDVRCMGCNMELPSVLVKKMRDEKRIGECENCGRMIFIAD